MEYHQPNVDPLSDMSTMKGVLDPHGSLPSLQSIIRPILHGDEGGNESFGWSDFPVLTGKFNISPNNSTVSNQQQQQRPHQTAEEAANANTNTNMVGLFGSSGILGKTSIQIRPPQVAGPPKHGDEQDFVGDHASFGWGDFPVLAHSTLTKTATTLPSSSSSSSGSHGVFQSTPHHHDVMMHKKRMTVMQKQMTTVKQQRTMP